VLQWTEKSLDDRPSGMSIREASSLDARLSDDWTEGKSTLRKAVAQRSIMPQPKPRVGGKPERVQGRPEEGLAMKAMN
jgi:hypothetical protein